MACLGAFKSGNKRCWVIMRRSPLKEPVIHTKYQRTRGEMLAVGLFAGLMAAVQTILPLPYKLLVVPSAGILLCLLLIFPTHVAAKKLFFERRTRLVDSIGFTSLMVENIAILSTLNLPPPFAVLAWAKVFALSMVIVTIFSVGWRVVFERLIYPFMTNRDDQTNSIDNQPA